MTTWGAFAGEDPALAAMVRACFAVRKHATLATVRRDGSPRISGIEVEWPEDGPRLGMMPGSVKARDLQRDPRLAVHSPTVDAPDDEPAAWLGEAKLAGRAVAVTGAADPGEPLRFRVYVTEVVHTTGGAPGDHLLITSWDPVRGHRERQRR